MTLNILGSDAMLQHDMRSAVITCAKLLCLPNQKEEEQVLAQALNIASKAMQCGQAQIFTLKHEKTECICRWSNKKEKLNLSFDAFISDLRTDQFGPFHRNSPVSVTDSKNLLHKNPKGYSILRELEISSFISMPLEIDSQLTGILIFENLPAEVACRAGLFITLLSYFICSFLWRKSTLDRLDFLSRYDALTGLKNRNAFIMDSERGFSLPTGVIYLDMNGLKEINDRYGHRQGDEALIRLARIIIDLFGSDSCYRMGGDEYVIICENIDRADFDACVISLAGSFSSTRDTSVSMGAHWTDQDISIDKILGVADQRMYQDKKAYYRDNPVSERYRCLTDDLLELKDPIKLEALIRADNFQVFYQPKFSTKTRKLTGAEALARFYNRKHTLESPTQFVQILEQYHLICQLDFFVLETVCRHISKWLSQGIPLVPISVNFSKDTLRRPDIAKKITQILDQYQVPLDLIEIEITETLEDTPEAVFYETLHALKDHGLNIAIDDFGIRHSNLNLLIDVDFNTLKIDKNITDSLYKSNKARRFLASITNICREMNISVTVEGVETEEQMDVINELDCSTVQGYLLSRPLPRQIFESEYLKL